jgi:hypothetical protein
MSLVLLSSACGEIVTPQPSDAGVDVRDAVDSTALTDHLIVHDSGAIFEAGIASPDVEARDVATEDEALRPPFSRVTFIDTSLRRSDQLERVEAIRVAPSSGGSWQIQSARDCVLESNVYPTITRFADTLEVRQLSPEQAPFFAEVLPDGMLWWRSYSNIFDAGDRLRITANRADWARAWQIELTTPVSVTVTTPATPTHFVSYSQPLLFRWRSEGVSPDAIVRITFRRFGNRGYDHWRLMCDVEPWREQATIFLPNYPAFPALPIDGAADLGLNIFVDTIITHQDTLPNGELVIVETTANAMLIAPVIQP